MADGEQILRDTPMSDVSSRELLAELSQCGIQELLRIRGERIAQSSQNQQTTSSTSNSLGSSFPPSIPAALSVPAKIDANLPKWNGKSEDFGFYMRRLELRVERELSPFVDPCRICFGDDRHSSRV
ncbi:hypothetical protein K3495_g12184 [Podosphaera aphanis]|nr:hypothetical protein K3495_g12184 [Podosphaera aphanis]